MEGGCPLSKQIPVLLTASDQGKWGGSFWFLQDDLVPTELKM